VALFADSGSIAGRVFYGVSHEPLARRDSIFGAGVGLRLALMLRTG
jgi:hypothetical protein